MRAPESILNQSNRLLAKAGAARLGRVLSHDPLRKITIYNFAQCRLSPLEELDRLFVFLCRSLGSEGPEISSLSGLGIFFARI